MGIEIECSLVVLRRMHADVLNIGVSFQRHAFSQPIDVIKNATAATTTSSTLGFGIRNDMLAALRLRSRWLADQSMLIIRVEGLGW